MLIAIEQTLQALQIIVQSVPVGTNLALIHLMWSILNGSFLRPKSNGRVAQFYTLVSERTCEEDFARHRQLFLTEQGYAYRIITS